MNIQSKGTSMAKDDLTPDEIDTILCENSANIICAVSSDGKVKKFVADIETKVPGTRKGETVGKPKTIISSSLQGIAKLCLQNKTNTEKAAKDYGENEKKQISNQHKYKK